MKLQNLKVETLSDLREHGKTAEDVRWVGTRGRKIPLDVFAVCAVVLTVVFSFVFAYKTTQIQIVDYLKAE